MIDLSRAEGNIARAADVCVVGAGVAGQTVAARLARAGKSVLLVEAGGLDFDARTQALAAGPNIGFEYYELEHSRLRLYGGTTAIWGGRCAALDPIDFERRPWVPHSGWPIGYDALDPFVDQAFAALGLPRPRSFEEIGAAPLGFDPDKIDTPLWAFDEKGERFTDAAALADPNIGLVINANLTEIRNGDGGAVERLVFRSLNGRSLEVEAAAYVLAAGGIETPRLMLACAPDRPAGIGNGFDLVGRYFMEHPHARGGEFLPLSADIADYARLLRLAPRSYRRGGVRFAPVIRPAEAAQERLGILNTSLSLGVRRHENSPEEFHARVIGGMKHRLPAKRRNRRIYHTGKKAVVRALESVPLSWRARKLASGRKTNGLYAVVRAEQAPNPDSRVTLAAERDELGVPRAALDWRLKPLDRESVAGLLTLLEDEVERMGVGRVDPAPWLSDDSADWVIDHRISSHPIGGYHHLGGVRMAAAPSEGVCDQDCRVFESPNLYVAGSSLFPTGGWANPTITIMALAMRLGDHLAKVVPGR